jgi:hypothetical protein
MEWMNRILKNKMEILVRKARAVLEGYPTSNLEFVRNAIQHTYNQTGCDFFSHRIDERRMDDFRDYTPTTK